MALSGPLLVGLVVIVFVVEVFVVVRIDVAALASAFAIVVLVVLFIVDRWNRAGDGIHLSGAGQCGLHRWLLGGAKGIRGCPGLDKH